LGKPYCCACDVYSFAILFWEMMALKVPYECYTIKKLKERAWSDIEKRPLVDESWPVPIKLLLKKSWSNDWTNRFTMNQVEEILRKECVRMRDGDSTGLEHQRRRSTFVFRGNAKQARKAGLRGSKKKSTMSGVFSADSGQLSESSKEMEVAPKKAFAPAPKRASAKKAEFSKDKALAPPAMSNNLCAVEC
jgi:hypothetical protein